MAEKKTKKTAKTSQKSKQNTRSRKNETKIDEAGMGKKREIQGIVLIAVGLFLAVSFFTHLTGALGEMLDSFFKGCFGIGAYVLAVYLCLYGALMIIGKSKVLSTFSTIFFVLLFLNIVIINSVRFVDPNNTVIPVLGLGDIYADGSDLQNGGIIGMIFATLLVKFIGTVGSYILSMVLVIVSLILIVDRSGKRVERRREKTKEITEPEEKKTKEKPLPEPEIKQIETKEESVPKGYIIPDYDRTRKAIRKANLDDNQKRILGYMTDENLVFGNGSSNHVEGFGLDGSQESLTSDPVYENNEVTETVIYSDEPISEIHDQQLSFIEGRAFGEEKGPETKTVSLGEKKEEKLSNKQAREAMLDKSEINKTKKVKKYKMPSVNLLNKAERKGTDLAALAEKTKKLEETLEAFHVDAKVIAAVPGPAVTRYEIQPGVGVKVHSITKLSDDIALNLRAKSIRIEAPIPGKAAIGIEIENDKVNMVTIREIIESQEFRNAKSKISFAVGKDIAGRAIIGDLKGMPHLLIAGSTGSGKSVCINSIIASILYKATPDEVKLVLIDPKVVELGNYNGIPHLLIPVVTEPAKAAAALNWAVAEMNDRYKKFAEAGVRDLESYNEHIAMMNEDETPLPQIVIIIDELADLMIAAPSQVEESICRLAQMARAAGMHLIVATQRPSVDVITGVIKANIPSRIAFAVSSQFDSRTILDMSGAEKLVGKGDMLYNPLGMGKPIRVQGTFISDNEVNTLIDFVRSQTEEVQYAEDVLSTIDKNDQPSQSDSDADRDDLMDECIELVVQSGQASVSMLQRRFRIGYNRAARIMDMMEAAGIVGPQDGSRPRQVLMTEDELHGNTHESETEEGND